MSDISSADNTRSEAIRLAPYESYKKYLIGVQTLHNPNVLRGVHTSPGEEVDPATVAINGASAIWSGLKETMSNVMLRRSDSKHASLLSNALRYNVYAEDLRDFVDEYYTHEQGWVKSLNQDLLIVRPAPFLDPNLFRQICEVRAERLTAERLMGGLVIHNMLRKDFEYKNKEPVIGLLVPKMHQT
jgi:hypothetical protein